MAYRLPNIMKTTRGVLFILLWMASSSCWCGISLTPREGIIIMGEMVMLGDVALVEGAESTLTHQIKSIPLGRSPRPGETINYSKSTIRARLLRAGVDVDELEIELPGLLKCTRAVQVVTGEDILNAAIELTKEKCAGGDGDVVISPVRRPKDIEIATGEVELKAELLSNDLCGWTQFSVDIYRDGEFAAKSHAYLDVERHIKVVKAAEMLSRGTELGPENLILEDCVYKSNISDAYISIEEIEGMTARVSIQAGKVILPNMLTPKTLIERGDLVKVIVKVGRVELSMTGNAKKDGCEGDIIPIETDKSNESLLARVEAPGVVVID